MQYGYGYTQMHLYIGPNFDSLPLHNAPLNSILGPQNVFLYVNWDNKFQRSGPGRKYDAVL